MKKSTRIQERVEELQKSAPPAVPGLYSPYYESYFTCFDAAEYYEAHDVLEHLWLHDTEEKSPHWFLYKGLIQLAGAYVHLKKHYFRPHHYKFANRLHPAVRLFHLALQNTSSNNLQALDLNISAVHNLIRRDLTKIENSNFSENPWRPEKAPRLSPLRFKGTPENLLFGIEAGQNKSLRPRQHRS
ncbi:MAG: DUF309 domain-containing protein [Chthoniobacterales bacterium]